MKAAGVEAPTTRPEKAASVACGPSTPSGIGVSFDTAMSAEPQTQSQNGHISIGEIDNLGTVINRLVDRIDELEDRLEAVEADDRDDHLQRVIDHADRKNRGSTAALNYAEVMAAADVSAPTAYSYMDELAENHDRVREDTALDGSKRILIDP